MTTPKKAVEVVAKPKTLKKDDSLSSFSSDDDIKPGKFLNYFLTLLNSCQSA